MINTVENKQEIQRLKLQISKYKQTEKSLLKKIESLDSFSKELNAWIWEMDIHGNYTYSNSTVESILGYKIDEIINRNILNLWFKEYSKSSNSLEQLRIALKSNKRWKNLPSIFEHKNGSKVYSESTSYPIYDDDDNIVGYRGIDHDITKQKITEEKLRNSEKQLKNFIANMPVGLYRTNESGDVLMANPALVSMLKYDSLTDLQNTNIVKVKKINKSERKKFKHEFNENDELIGKETIWLTKDNSEIFIRENAKVIRKENGDVDYYEGAVEDITESKLAKEKLKKSEEQFRMIAENTNDLITISNLNLKAHYTYVSPSIKQISGFDVDELVGKSAFDFMHPDDKKKMFPFLKKIIKKNISNLFLSQPKLIDEIIEYRALHKSGNWRYMQSSGNIIGGKMLFVSRDITEQKQAQEKLRTSEHRLKKAKGIANIEFFEYDLINGEVFVTDRVKALYNLEIKNNIIDPEPIFKLTHPDDLVLIKNTIELVRKGKTPNPIDCRIIRPNKEIIWVHANFELSFNINRKLQSLFVTLLDITESKKAEEEIEHARERLGIANSILRHDITNDLIVINSAVQIFKKNSDLKMLDEIIKRISKSLNLIKLHRDQENFIDSLNELKRIELAPILYNIIENYGEIDINISGNETVYADTAINSVFENLLSNSLKHGNATKIDIIISSNKKICEIKVIDNGKGINENIKDKIFDKGFIHGKNGHTGIGLHIVKQTIISYGGKIFVEDNEPNGTVFIIILRKVISNIFNSRST
ncbi:MAG: PAS domain S-box protein [Candidatus Tenebribacter davisii]|nr:PAS domain S-box protein [Candidatus Tenebribacter davisii]